MTGLSSPAVADLAAPCQADASRRHCRDIVRRRARNFYFGLKLTPEPRRSALYAVYAWMRLVDDIADADLTVADPQAALDEVAASTQASCFGGTDAAPTEGAARLELAPLLPALAEAVRTYALPWDAFASVLRGMRADLHADRAPSAAGVQPRFVDDDALLAYCRDVASMPGVLCVRIWGLRSGVAWEQAEPPAIERGIAFQLTNILRDLRSDLDGGRCYVPALMLDAFGLTTDALAAGAPGARGLVEALVARARAAYDSSATLDTMVLESSRPALAAMTAIYRGLLERIAADPQAIHSGRRISVPTAQKVVIATRLVLAARLRSR